MSVQHVGALVRDWRTLRRRSQLDLAQDVGVSARHLSFVETGRSRPSPELIGALADRLDLPMRERNVLLLAAGYAPRFRETDLGAEAMIRVRAALQRLLDTHDPYPGIVIDRAWNVVLANGAARALIADVPEELLGPPVNVFRVCLHPDGLARRTTNFDEWARYLVSELHRLARQASAPEVAELAAEVLAYPNVAAVVARTDGSTNGSSPAGEPTLLVPFRLDVEGRAASFFTTLTSFGTPQDVTLSELVVELFFPDDEGTEALLRRNATGASGPGDKHRRVSPAG